MSASTLKSIPLNKCENPNMIGVRNFNRYYQTVKPAVLQIEIRSLSVTVNSVQ